MSLLIKLTVILSVVLALWVYLRNSRRRHVARFGPPPPNAQWRTMLFFALWSVLWLAVGWWSAHALAITLSAALGAFAITGLGPRRWSWRQQLRDGGIYSAACVGTLSLVAFYGFGNY
jgi:hypothetical protein